MASWAVKLPRALRKEEERVVVVVFNAVVVTLVAAEAVNRAWLFRPLVVGARPHFWSAGV